MSPPFGNCAKEKNISDTGSELRYFQGKDSRTIEEYRLEFELDTLFLHLCRSLSEPPTQFISYIGRIFPFLIPSSEMLIQYKCEAE